MNNSLRPNFTPSLLSADALEVIFVQREQLIREILERIRKNAFSPLKQHTLLVGSRGPGKMHLIAPIYYRVLTMKDIRDRLLIVWLRKDESGDCCLRELLIGILRALPGQMAEDSKLEERIESLHLLSPEQAELAAGETLIDVVGERTLLLLVEDLDELFRSLGRCGQMHLRSFLHSNPIFSIVAASAGSFGDLLDSGAPFWDFFQIRHLEELTYEDATQLFSKVARYEADPDLSAFIAKPGSGARVLALRSLTAGNDRAPVLLSQLMARDSLDEFVEPLMRTVEDLTPHYRSRIADLRPEERKIIKCLGESRHPVSLAEIARSGLVPSEIATEQLESLRERGFLRSVDVGQDRYYELSEPLMRLSIEVSKHRQRPIRLLLDFLRLWYSPGELRHGLALLPPDAVLGREYVQPAILPAEKDCADPCIPECCSEYQLAVDGGDYARALRAAEKLVSARGQVADIFAHAACLSRLGRHNDSVALYDRILTQAPGNAEAYQQRGWALLRLHRFEDALASCDKSLELDRSASRAWCCRGSILIGLGWFDEALSSCDRAIQLSNQDSLGWITRGMAQAEMEWYEDASASFSKAVELEPVNARAHECLGAALVELKRHDEALAHANQAIELEPEDPIAWTLRGSALAGLARHAEALKSFDRALEMGGQTSVVHFRRAEALVALRRWREAAACLDAALGNFAHSDNPDAGNTSTLIRKLFSSLNDPRMLQLSIKVLVLIYRKHQVLPALGHGLVGCTADIASPENFSDAAARFWLDSWKAIAGGFSGFGLPLRFLDFALRFRETRDPRVFMELPLEERTVLEPIVRVRVHRTA